MPDRVHGLAEVGRRTSRPVRRAQQVVVDRPVPVLAGLGGLPRHAHLHTAGHRVPVAPGQLDRRADLHGAIRPEHCGIGAKSSGRPRRQR